jgi:uncharacterized membrane protein
MAQFNIQGSPKTLQVNSVNPALALAVKSALKTKYKSNPHPFMSSYVFLTGFANW